MIICLLPMYVQFRRILCRVCMYECVCTVCIFEYNTHGTEGQPGTIVQWVQDLHCVQSPGFDAQHCRHKSGMMAPSHYHSTWEAEGEVWNICAQPGTLSMKHKRSDLMTEWKLINRSYICGVDSLFPSTLSIFN